MKYIILLSLYALYFPCLFAQQNKLENMPITVSYFGENGIHPGLKVGIEQPLIDRTKEKDRLFKKRQEKYGTKVKTREIYAAHGIGVYHHPKNHMGLFLNSELGVRRITARKGHILGVSVGAGFLHRFYHVDTYELNSEGKLDRVSAAGRGSFMMTVSATVGKDLSKTKDIPMRWYIKPGLQFSDYNNYFIPNAVLELGVSVYPWRKKK